LLLTACSKKTDAPVIVPDEPPVDTVYVAVPFEHVPTIDNMVMYEVNLRAFSQAGNLQGVISRLDDLKSMGVNVLWLMPIYPIGQINSVNSPYSVKNYEEVNPEFGTLADLRNLIGEAHGRNMAVILDWVANHTAWDNPWISNTSWYTQDGAGNIVHPPGTNWLDVADLNFDNADMRHAMIGAMKYWINEANVDGYRCDYADGVPYDFWKMAIDSLKTMPGRTFVLLAEGSRSDHFEAGFDMTYGWDFYGALKNVYSGQSATLVFNTHISEYQQIPAGKARLRFTTNHDESAWDNTPMVLFGGEDGALSASVLSIFMGGVPLIYTGQEVGRVEKVPFFTNSPIDWTTHPEMYHAYREFMTIYQQSETLRQGNLQDFSGTDVVCFTKNIADSRFLILVNVRNVPHDFTLPAMFHQTTWIDALTGETVNLGDTVRLESYQYLILKE